MGARRFGANAGDRVAVGLALLALALQCWRHWSFRSTTYDLAVFDQVLWKLSHGHGATSSLTAWNAFADHLSPILLVFVPLYWLAATPLWLFAAQAAAVAWGYLALRPLLVELGVRERRHQRVFLIAYAANPLLWNAVLFDFHPTTLAVPLVIVGLTAALRHDRWRLALSAVGLVLLRDDLAVAAAAIAVVGWRGDTAGGRRLRTAVVLGGLAWTAAGGVLGEAMGASRHWDARYGYLGASATDALLHPLHSVPALVGRMFSSGNTLFLAALLVPVAFLPVRRPFYLALALLLALPVLAADDSNFHSPAFHYGAPLLPFVLLAAAAGFVALPARVRWPHAGWLAVSLTASSMLVVGPPATGSLSYRTVPIDDARRAVATVRPDDDVVATTFMAAHVARRQHLLPFPYPFVDAKRNFPLDPAVTEVSADRMATVDVVLVGPPTIRSELAARREFARLPVIQEEFTAERYGEVTVYRRIP